MSFLNEIQGFSKSKLKSTDTVVQTVDGRTLCETKDKYGHITSQVTSTGAMGFVGDYKPDLQVAFVMPGLCFGSQDVAADFDILKSFRITHILNIASHVDNKYPDDFIYHRQGILDIPETDIRSHFPVCFRFIDEGRQSGCVFVHCNAGVSRAASMVIGYLMKTEGMEFQKAFDHVKFIRPCIRPNDGFMFQLRHYVPE